MARYDQKSISDFMNEVLNDPDNLFDSVSFKTQLAEITSNSKIVYMESYSVQVPEANDTNRIKRAISDLHANGGTLILNKDYTISGALDLFSNINMVGTGSITGSSGSYLMALYGNQIVSGIKFNNTFSTTTGVVCLDIAQNASNITIERCKFNGVQNYSININNLGISHITIKGNLFDGVQYGVLTNVGSPDLYDVKITGNTFINVYGDGVEINYPSSGSYSVPLNAREFLIADNYFNSPNPSQSGNNASSGFGVGIAGASHVTIHHNMFENCRWQAVHIEDHSKHIKITDNVMVGGYNITDGVAQSPVDGYSNAISVIDCDYLIIKGNTTTHWYGDGIYLQYNGTPQTNNNSYYYIVENNIVKGNQGSGIKVVGGSHGLVHGNISTSNGAYGFFLSDLTNIRFTDNESENNVSGGLYLNGMINGHHFQGFISSEDQSNAIILGAGFLNPVSIKNVTSKRSGIISATFVTLNVVDLGKYATGKLTLNIKIKDNGNYFITKVYDVSWDGTTLTNPILLTSASSGQNFSIDSTPMSGSIFQVKIYNASNGTVMESYGTFDGTIIRK